MKNVNGVAPRKNKKAIPKFILIIYKYTNLFAIELCRVSSLHRENILNIAKTMTEYLPMTDLQKPVLLYNLIILRVLSNNIKRT